MKYFVLALPFLALPCVAWATDDVTLPTSLGLDLPCVQERPPIDSPSQEEERVQLSGNSLTPMEYIYRYSELEAGFTYTDWASKLSLSAHVGGYVRWGVGILPGLNVNIAFRDADYGNNDASVDEHVFERALFVGLGLRVPLTPEFALCGNAAVGAIRFDSRAAGIAGDTGPAFALEAAATVRIWEVLRLRVGFSLDAVDTEFHRTSSSWALNRTWLVGFELGG